MNLRVENIGKVDKAQIEIDGVTLLTGYNGTGKSSICRALYGVMDSFSDIKRKVMGQKYSSMFDATVMFIRRLEEETLVESLHDLRDDIFTLIAKSNEYEVNILSEEQLSELCLKNKVLVSDTEIADLVNKLNVISERDEEEYIRFVVSRNIKNIFGNQIAHVNSHKPSGIILEEYEKTCEVMFQDNELMGMKHILNILKAPIYIEPENILDSYTGDVRDARGQSGRNSQFIERFLMSEYESSSNDFTLEQYVELEKNTKLIKNILYEVTHGRLENVQNRRAFTYHEEGMNENISCRNIASGLKPFLMIQRLVENGSLNEERLLIMDEPEINLHPEWQLRLAKVLVLLNTQLNVRIVLSTHSPYFLKAVDYYLQEEHKRDVGHFYLTKETENGLYTVEDVTDNKELIYKTMYRPLEELG